MTRARLRSGICSKGALVATGAALAYAVPHLAWGAGSKIAFPGDDSQIPSSSRDRALAFWGMGAVGIGAAAFAWSYNRPRMSPAARAVRIGVGYTAGAALVGWGAQFISLSVLLATGRVVSAPRFAAQDARRSPWELYWYPLFICWGLGLMTAAHHLRARDTSSSPLRRQP